MRFEGLPGEFSQHDFGHVDVVFVGGRKQRTHFFGSRLDYSRSSVVTLVDDERVETIVRCLARHFVGGETHLAIAIAYRALQNGFDALFTTAAERGPALHDDDLADAIVDRILERGRLLRLDGPSVRTKHLPAHELDDQDGEADSRRISGKSTAELPEPTHRRSSRSKHPARLARYPNKRLVPSSGGLGNHP